MHVDGSLENLLQGVSQQPARNRFPGQAEAQDNALADIVTGWRRRPPTEHVSALFSLIGTGTEAEALAAKWHFYDTGTEQYIVAFTNFAGVGLVTVYDLEGNSLYNGPSTYLASGVPRDSIRVVTIGDYTIVANRDVIPQMSGNVAPIPHGAIIQIEGGEYGKTYEIQIDGLVAATYSTPSGSDPGSHAKQTGTEYIAEKLFADFHSAGTGYVAGGTGDVTATGASVFYSANYGESGDIEGYSATFGDWLSVAPGATDIVVLRNGSETGFTIGPDDQGFHAGDVFVTSEAGDTISATYNEPTGPTSWADDYILSLHNNVLFIQRKVLAGFPNDIDIDVSDDKGGDLMTVIQRSVREVGDLPAYATRNFTVRVEGDAEEGADDFFMRFTQTDDHNGFGKVGIWRETAAPGTEVSFDVDTMPHALIRLPNGNFHFGPLDGATVSGLEKEKWVLKDAGDSDSNPLPDFIGKNIENIGAFQDRLYILADEFVNFSATGSYFNFFAKSATTLIASDPIFIASSHEERTVLRHAEQHNRNLVIMSDKVQFIIQGSQGLSAEQPPAMLVSTAFSADMGCAPRSAGENVFFAIDYGKFAGIREFFTETEIDSNNSRAITDHVSRYISGRALSMASSSNLDSMLVLTDQFDNIVYLYEYTWQGQERVQSAWGRFVFSEQTQVLHAFFYDDLLYFIMRHTDTENLDLVKIDMTDPVLGTLDHNIYLDRRRVIPTVLEGGVPAVPKLLGAVVGIPVGEDQFPVVVAGPDCTDPPPGTEIDVVSEDDNFFFLSRDADADVVVGYPYTTLYEPTTPIIKDRNGVPVGTGSLVIGEYRISFDNTGPFKGVVKHPNYPDNEQKFSGRVLGSAVLGEIPIDEGTFRIAVRKDSKKVAVEISTDSFLPMNLLDIEWVGQYKKKGRRI